MVPYPDFKLQQSVEQVEPPSIIPISHHKEDWSLCTSMYWACCIVQIIGQSSHDQNTYISSKSAACSALYSYVIRVFAQHALHSVPH